LAHSVRAPTYLKRVGTFGALETVSHKHVPNTRAAARQAVAHDNAASSYRRAAQNGAAGRRLWHHGRAPEQRQRRYRLAREHIGDGATLVTLIFTFGAVSGAHFNPAVTLADAGQGGLRWRDVSVYIAAQALVGWPQFSAAD